MNRKNMDVHSIGMLIANRDTFNHLLEFSVCLLFYAFTNDFYYLLHSTRLSCICTGQQYNFNKKFIKSRHIFRTFICVSQKFEDTTFHSIELNFRRSCIDLKKKTHKLKQNPKKNVNRFFRTQLDIQCS